VLKVYWVLLPPIISIFTRIEASSADGHPNEMRPAFKPAAWTVKQLISSAQSGTFAGLLINVQLQLVL
jgi:hypothetical protein